MCPASNRPNFGLFDREQVPCEEPELTVDTVAGLLLGANPGGWAAWGLDPATAAPPFAIDGAMPALQRLREIAGGHGAISSGPEALTFWTARGVMRLVCRVRRMLRRRASSPSRRSLPSRRGGLSAQRRAAQRGARCLAGARAADAAQRRHRLCRDPQGRALRAARQRALQGLCARHLRERAPCARRGRQHAAGRSEPVGRAAAGLRRARARARGGELPDGRPPARRACRPGARGRSLPRTCRASSPTS